jgi:hypothetical protein
MVVYTCKKCGDINYLTSEALGNLAKTGVYFVILLPQKHLLDVCTYAII